MIIRSLFSLFLLVAPAPACFANFYDDIVNTKSVPFDGPALVCIRQVLGGGWSGTGPPDLESVLRDLDKRINNVWITSEKPIVVKFDVSKEGTISNTVVLKSSGVAATDISLIEALQKIALKPLQDGLPGLSLTLTFGKEEKSNPKTTVFVQDECAQH